MYQNTHLASPMYVTTQMIKSNVQELMLNDDKKGFLNSIYLKHWSKMTVQKQDTLISMSKTNGIQTKNIQFYNYPIYIKRKWLIRKF